MTQTPKPPISHIDGVSVETVDVVARAVALTDCGGFQKLEEILNQEDWGYYQKHAKAAITALLASGEVVLQSRLEESLKDMADATEFLYQQLLPHTEGKRGEVNEAYYNFLLAKSALAAFTKPPLVDLMDKGE